MSDLDDLLSDEPNEEAIEQVEDEPQEEQVEAEAEKESEAEPEKVEEPEEDPREKEIAGLKAALSAARAKNREVREPEMVAPPQFQDPAGASYIQEQLAMMQANMAAELSEAKARATYDKVDEAFEAAENLGIIDRFKGTADPWGELAKWHKDFEETRQAKEILNQTGGDLAAYEAQLREKIRQEIQSEMVAEKVSAKAPSLAGETNLGQRQGSAWSGPTSLDDILG